MLCGVGRGSERLPLTRFGAELCGVDPKHVGQFPDVVADMHVNTSTFCEGRVHPHRPVDAWVGDKIARLDGVLRLPVPTFNPTETVDVVVPQVDGSDAGEIVEPVDLLKPGLDDALAADGEIMRQLCCQLALRATNENAQGFLEFTNFEWTREHRHPPSLFVFAPNAANQPRAICVG